MSTILNALVCMQIMPFICVCVHVRAARNHAKLHGLRKSAISCCTRMVPGDLTDSVLAPGYCDGSVATAAAIHLHFDCWFFRLCGTDERNLT